MLGWGPGRGLPSVGTWQWNLTQLLQARAQELGQNALLCPMAPAVATPHQALWRAFFLNGMGTDSLSGLPPDRVSLAGWPTAQSVPLSAQVWSPRAAGHGRAGF